MCFTGRLTNPKLNRGLSLAELMIASTLLLLLSGLAFQGLRYAIAYHHRIDAQQTLLTQTMNVLSHLERELEDSRIGSVLLNNPQQTLIFLSPRNDQGQITTETESGDLVWSTAVCYRVESGQLVRKQLPVPGASPITTSLLDLGLDFSAFAGAPVTRTVARNCSQFETEFSDRLGYVGTAPDGTAASYTPPASPPDLPLEEPSLIGIRLKLEQKGDRTYGVQVQASIHPRN